ncbi:hypothetical protein Tco_0843062 [Tanacetum coccineum]|uniref:Uncharacterized protein n=1 Tax=Tanacetum coccineum TaxID=301880 RepID=A0ABQ5B0Z9_9ASTR
MKASERKIKTLKRIKGEAVKEKDDPSAFIFPIRLEGKECKYENVDRGITMIDHTQAEAMGKLSNVLYQVGVTTIIAKFLILDIPIDRDTQLWLVGDSYTLGTHDREAGSSRSKHLRNETVEEIRAFNINEPIYAKLFHEFYSTYEFDEVCVDDELQSKKIIRFRLGGRAHRGLRSDDNFNATDYWLSISLEENLGLSRSHTSTIKNPILRVIYKMISYGLCQRTSEYDKVQKNDLWLLSMFDARHQNGYVNVAWVIAKWMKRKGVGTQKESQICCEQFISKPARKCRVLTEDVVRSLSAPIYCGDLDTTTLRD